MRKRDTEIFKGRACSKDNRVVTQDGESALPSCKDLIEQVRLVVSFKKEEMIVVNINQ